VTNVFFDPLEQSRRPVEPRLADREGVSEQVVATELDGGGHRGDEIACFRRSRVRALTCIDGGGQHPQPPGRLRQQLQLGRRELTAVVGRGQSVVCLAPFVPVERGLRDLGTRLIGHR